MTEEGHDSDAGSLGRRQFVQGTGALLALAAGSASMGSAAAQSGESTTIVDLLGPMPDNWGKWGDDDELGAINYLGSEEMFEGMNAAMQRGKKNIERFTLQTPITGQGIETLVPGDSKDEDDTAESGATTDTGDPAFPGRYPARRDNAAENPTAIGGMKFRDDKFVTPLYLQGTSHMDALGHGWYGDAGDWRDDQLYNGHSAQTTRTAREYEEGVDGCDGGEVTKTYGLGKNDVSNAGDAGVSGRGVLLDVGRYKGDENGWLELGEPITLEDLQATADAQSVEIRKRDILLIRTGAIERTRDSDAIWHPYFEPGLTYSDDLVQWVHEMEIPIIGADNLPVEKVIHEVSPEDLSARDEDEKERLAGTYTLPLHGAFLRDLGVTLNEVLDLSELGAAAAEDGIYTFQYNAAPLHVEQATGGPVNPVVLKATEGGAQGSEQRGR